MSTENKTGENESTDPVSTPMTETETDAKTVSDTVESNQTSSLRMILTLGSVAMISGLLVVLTWQLTLAPIRANQQAMIEKSIFQVVPGATQRQSYQLTDGGVEAVEKSAKLNPNALNFYAAFDQQGKLKGIAAQSAAQGYAGMVSLLYGYDPQCECIRGFSIIQMAETPGLGDKILTDKNFLANFDALDAKVNPLASTLANKIVAVKHDTKTNDWEVDSISGATITSKAVANAINLGAQKLLPKLIAYLPQLKMSTTDDQQKNNGNNDKNKKESK